MAEDGYERTFNELLMLDRKVKNDDRFIRMAVEAFRTAFSERKEVPKPLMLFSSRPLDARTEFIQKLIEFLNTYNERLREDSEKLEKVVKELIPTAIEYCNELKNDVEVLKTSFQNFLRLWER